MNNLSKIQVSLIKGTLLVVMFVTNTVNYKKKKQTNQFIMKYIITVPIIKIIVQIKPTFEKNLFRNFPPK